MNGLPLPSAPPASLSSLCFLFSVVEDESFGIPILDDNCLRYLFFFLFLLGFGSGCEYCLFRDFDGKTVQLRVTSNSVFWQPFSQCLTVASLSLVCVACVEWFSYWLPISVCDILLLHIQSEVGFLFTLFWYKFFSTSFQNALKHARHLNLLSN